MHRDPTLQLVLQTALDGVIVMGSDGVIADWNTQAEHIFGWSRNDIVGRELGQYIIPERYREAHRQGLRHFLASGEGPLLSKRIEITALRKSGEEFPIELSICPVVRGTQTLFLGFARDITDRRAAERVLANQAKEAVLLHRVTTLASETSSRDEVLRVCLESVCDLTGWPAGHAFLVAADRSLVSTCWVGDEVAFTHLRAATAKHKFGPGVGLPGRILDTGQPEWIADILDSDQFIRARTDVDLGIRACFGFPIAINGEVVAVLEFFCAVPVNRDETLLLTVRTMGNQVGRVMERRRVEEHQMLLLEELNHRAKNMLTVVMGMATQTARNVTSVDAFKKDFFDRLNSLCRAYSLLTSKNWQPSSLDALVSTVVAPHAGRETGQLKVIGGAVRFEPKMALAMSMILHELTTNATKYGALSSPTGRITISSQTEHRPDGKVVHVRWDEQGLAGLKAPFKTGFGTKLIETSVRHELGGDVTTSYDPGGIRYDLAFPEPPAV